MGVFIEDLKLRALLTDIDRKVHHFSLFTFDAFRILIGERFVIRTFDHMVVRAKLTHFLIKPLYVLVLPVDPVGVC